MSRVDDVNSLRAEVAELKRMYRDLANATPLSNASVGRGRLRMYDGSELLIEDGNLTITGTATVDGQLVGSGTFTWTGTTNLDGPVIIDGATTINGATALKGNMTVSGGGKVTVGAISLLPSGGPFGGGSIVGSSGVYVSAPTLHATGNVYAAGKVISTGRLEADGGALVTGNLNVTGNSTVSGSKSFRITHPTKPGMWLTHGSTESPVSGTEYAGVGVFGSDGRCEVVLPDYFEALNKPTNRTVQITPVGSAFPVGASVVAGGMFTAFGDAGESFAWLVKAERLGADFEVESPVV